VAIGRPVRPFNKNIFIHGHDRKLADLLLFLNFEPASRRPLLVLSPTILKNAIEESAKTKKNLQKLLTPAFRLGIQTPT
jgi:hypothetical protein